MSLSAFPGWWVDKFADLPLLRVPSLQDPVYDGDMAIIDQLIDSIIELMPAPIATTPSDTWIYDQTMFVTGIDPQKLLDFWPMDKALALLREWT